MAENLLFLFHFQELIYLERNNDRLTHRPARIDTFFLLLLAESIIKLLNV